MSQAGNYPDCEICGYKISTEDAAAESADNTMNAIVGLYAKWRIINKNVDATLVENFVEWVQLQNTSESLLCKEDDCDEIAEYAFCQKHMDDFVRDMEYDGDA